MKITKNLKVNSILFIIGVLIFTAFSPVMTSADEGINEKLGVPIIVYGSSLTGDQRDEVKTLFNFNKLEGAKELEVNGTDVAKYIGGDSNSRMFSSAKIIRKDNNHGIIVNILTADNITQVTSDMYKNAMLTAGVEDAEVEIASPVKVSGHSALTGIYKAYDAQGVGLDQGRMEVANDELDIATDLASRDGMSEEKVTELLTEIKKAIAEQDPATKEDVERIVKEQLDKLEIKLSDADRQLLIDLFEKMRDLDIDFDKVKEQLEDLTSTIKDKLGDLDLDLDNGFWEKVQNFFKNLIDKISSWFD